MAKRVKIKFGSRIAFVPNSIYQTYHNTHIKTWIVADKIEAYKTR